VIAALFVETGGVYYGLDGVDPWDRERDARLYAGPHPVVCHPPCERWGRYWGGGPMLQGTPRQKTLGDDDGCFASALASVRTWGGVLEHPEASHAWRHHALIPPLRGGGWSVADDRGGWTCCVEQGAYGHRARKATWLYAFGVELPVMQWRARGTFVRLDAGFHSKAERDAAPRKKRERLASHELAATPHPFRDVLLAMARSAYDQRRSA